MIEFGPDGRRVWYHPAQNDGGSDLDPKGDDAARALCRTEIWPPDSWWFIGTAARDAFRVRPK